MIYDREKLDRIASFITITADLFDGKPEITNSLPPRPDGKGGYVYDPEHKKSKADVQRELGNKPIHETPKGWAEGAEQLDMFKNNPTTSNENKDLFGNPVPAEKAVLPIAPVVEPPKPEPPAPKPDLQGQATLPIEQPTQEKIAPSTSTHEQPKKEQTHSVDPDGLRKAVKAISRQFNSPKSLETVPKSMLASIGGNIRKFDTKGLDIEMSVASPSGSNKSIVIKHDASPVNDVDKNMQALHSVGSAWAVTSGLSDDPEFQQQANKAWTKDLDNFVSKFTDLPFPGEEFKTYSPANWIAKGRFNPKTKAAFYKMFARGTPDSGDKTSLMVRSFLGALQVASDGEYGSGTPQQPDNDMSTKVSNMAGYVAQGFANDSGFMKKNMPLTTKLFESKMI